MSHRLQYKMPQEDKIDNFYDISIVLHLKRTVYLKKIIKPNLNLK
jgi:hypothetical protein